MIVKKSELELITLLFILVDELTEDADNLSKPSKIFKIHPMFASHESEGEYQILVCMYI